MGFVFDTIKAIKKDLPTQVKLVAVSKFHPIEAIQEAYDAGQRIFGESRMQEIDKKHTALPQDIEWHFIGHLQTNKVKSIVPYIHTVQSLDSWKLMDEIEKHASRIDKRIRCLLEVHIAEEDAKYGFSFEKCKQFLEEGLWKDCKYAYLGGVMGMATNTDNHEKIKEEFRSLKIFFEEIKENYFSDNDEFSEISMGMSDDYKLAIEEGSTMVRIGSSIFGNREY
ncbi:YggS family pyridoxal phosphate-dependent enzyme [Dysgonomonas sp. Marseille-P4361]|uniref:YggS family pyridoxal phosphate-dependent enzyme n=1 Tax=Dysgonomonas sp. Marseille-P4361 TaxID=2161820 RepID=UPI000D5533D8|nr:YggS family pyridoxal phosphate-dependent enzyme [Dysgonomonas sp. Marseille-P4361]